jgi:exodeoxyribonuclease V alpha subunit
VQDALRAAIERLDLDLLTRPSVPTDASTIHRLLGARPDSIYYRYHRGHPLALDVLVIDEASMADLALAAKLVEALPPHARLILLGDKDQLASVEAGAVLGDICRSTGYSTPFAKRLARVTQVPARSIATTGEPAQPLADSVALLSTSYRFGPETGIGKLARLVNHGEGRAALALLQNGGHADLAWRTVGAGDLRAQLGAGVAEGLRPYCEAVRGGANAQEIFERFHRFRVLCAHRRGLFGVGALNRMIEEKLDQAGLVSARDTWYPGRPVMITRNDYNLRLFNGDIGIVLRDANAADALRIFLPGADGGMRSIAPARLPEHETVYAMTIHKAQGSEFGRVLMILPDELTPIMTRELVYTGITRARSEVEIWGGEQVLRDAVGRRLVRDSALHERLWPA